MEKTSKSLQQRFREFLPVIYLITLLLALRSVLIEPYVVPTGSMEPTLKVGDRLYALKCAYSVRFPFTNWTLFRTGQVKRGDVILFDAPHNPGLTYVKRAVGIAGDKIAFRDGVLYVNGEPMPKQPQTERSLLYDIDRKDEKTLYVENLTGVRHWVILHDWLSDNPTRYLTEIEVPADHLFAVGDNRDNSHDSRAWGFVPIENLKGRAMFIWFSSPVEYPGPNSWIEWGYRFILRILSFWTWDIRFERLGTLIR